MWNTHFFLCKAFLPLLLEGSTLKKQKQQSLINLSLSHSTFPLLFSSCAFSLMKRGFWRIIKLQFFSFFSCVAPPATKNVDVRNFCQVIFFYSFFSFPSFSVQRSAHSIRTPNCFQRAVSAVAFQLSVFCNNWEAHTRA